MLPFTSHRNRAAEVEIIGATEVGPLYWLGRCNNGVEYMCGQTFTTTNPGILHRISIFVSQVPNDCVLTLCLHSIIDNSRHWGAKKAEVSIPLARCNENSWVAFELPHIQTQANEHLGFKLSCSNGMLAIAECPWRTCNPYRDGEEWVGSSICPEGSFNHDFDFAFAVELQLFSKSKFL